MTILASLAVQLANNLPGSAGSEPTVFHAKEWDSIVCAAGAGGRKLGGASLRQPLIIMGMVNAVSRAIAGGVLARLMKWRHFGSRPLTGWGAGC